VKAFIHPTRAIIELPEQIYAERNKLLVEKARLERRLKTVKHMHGITLRRLKTAGIVIADLQKRMPRGE